jgi:uncharacterized protein YkwD
MILPIFVAGILMLGILLAATARGADDNAGGGETQAPPPATETPPPAEAPPATETPPPAEAPPATETPPPAEAPPATETPPPAEAPPATETPPPAEAPPATETPPPEAPPAGASQESNNTNFVNTILGIHNRERAAVGVPPLVWSDSLAASAQTWAEHLATINQMVHSPSTGRSYGQNIAGSTHGFGDTLPTMVESWVAEKKNWHGGVLTEENWYPTSHYTAMVWKTTTEIGCGMATGSVNDYLVCHYSPWGNFIGQSPY